MDSPAPDLSIIIVSWNVRELLDGCLRSLTEGSGVGGRGSDGQSSVASRMPVAPLRDPSLVEEDSGEENTHHATRTTQQDRPTPDPRPPTPEIIVVDNATTDRT